MEIIIFVNCAHFIVCSPMAMYAKNLQRKMGMTEDFPAIHGDIKAQTRLRWLSQFKVPATVCLLPTRGQADTVASLRSTVWPDLCVVAITSRRCWH